MRIQLWGAALAAVLFSGFFSAEAGASVVIDRVVAVVNNEVITLSELQREASVRKIDGSRDQRLLLEDMIDRKIQMAAAKKAGMDVTDKELSDAVNDIMKRNGMEPGKFGAALAREGLTLEQYKSELREQMTLSRMFNKFVRSGVSIEETEVRAYYERNAEAYSQPEEVRVRQIFFRLPEGASAGQVEAVREKAEKAITRARKGEDFARLVKELSDSENAALGGDLGFMQRDQAVPEIAEAIRNLKPGEIAGPVRFGGGFHVLRVEEIRKQVSPYEKVKEEITKTLYEQKLESTYRTWLQTLRSDASIENRL